MQGQLLELAAKVVTFREVSLRFVQTLGLSNLERLNLHRSLLAPELTELILDLNTLSGVLSDLCLARRACKEGK